MELSVWVVSILGYAGVGFGLLFTVARLAFRVEAPLPTAAWIEELSLDRYRPMLRLLSQDDFRVLRAQPGFTWQMAARLRRQRCLIFRGYLRSLRIDFSRLCMALKLVMIQSGGDRPDLASALTRRQLSFASRLAVIYLRLELYSIGIGAVPVDGLLRLFEGLRLEVRNLAPAPIGA